MTSAPTAADASLRPAAHFTAKTNWLNDPNGLLFHDGTYHLFFQTNPSGTTWGNISWGHATSSDLVTWTEQDIAIPCIEDEMAFSGSAVVDSRNTAGFAGPGQTALVAIYTAARPQRDDRPASQAQALAYSVDDGQTWTRYTHNPVLDIGSDEFRDPKVFWYGDDDGHWVMVAVEAVSRQVVIYTSPNLIAWTPASRFGPAHAVGGVWECPDLFPLQIDGTQETKWVMIVSLNPGGIAGGSGAQYFVGDFDGATFTPDRISDSRELEDFDWLDYGHDYYAAVSFSNVPDGRRLMVGWASNWLYANETPTAPWRSSMSLVREMSLRRLSDGRLSLAQAPVLPSDGSPLLVHDLTVPLGIDDRTVITVGNQWGDEVSIRVDGSTRSVVCDRSVSGDVDFHDGFGTISRAPIPADAGATVDLQIVVDATVLEIFIADGLAVLTEQIFPTEPLAQVLVLVESP